MMSQHHVESQGANLEEVGWIGQVASKGFYWQQGLCDSGCQDASMRMNVFQRIFPSLSSPKVQDPGWTSQLAELIPG